MKGTHPAEALPRFDQPGRSTHHPDNSSADSPRNRQGSSGEANNNGRAAKEHRDSGNGESGNGASGPGPPDTS